MYSSRYPALFSLFEIFLIQKQLHRSNIFLRQMVRQGKIPFEISLVSPNDSNMQARIEFGKVISEIQADSVRNGTDKMTLDEINDIISE